MTVTIRQLGKHFFGEVSGVAVFVFLAAQQIGRDGNNAVLGKLITQTSQPVR